MIIFPKMPTSGTGKITGIYNTVRDIVNLLPKLAVVGDNKTTFVEHSPNGTMVRAKPVVRGGISVAGGIEKKYDGHFNVYVDKNTLGVPIVHITGGFFSINGLVSYISSYSMEASSVITSNTVFYATLEAEYDRILKTWKTPSFNFYTSQGLMTNAEYRCRFPLGEIQRYTKDNDFEYNVKCYEIQFPVLIIGGDCEA